MDDKMETIDEAIRRRYLALDYVIDDDYETFVDAVKSYNPISDEDIDMTIEMVMDQFYDSLDRASML